MSKRGISAGGSKELSAQKRFGPDLLGLLLEAEQLEAGDGDGDEGETTDAEFEEGEEA